eukprot:93530_1
MSNDWNEILPKLFGENDNHENIENFDIKYDTDYDKYYGLLFNESKNRKAAKIKRIKANSIPFIAFYGDQKIIVDWNSMNSHRKTDAPTNIFLNSDGDKLVFHLD